MDEPLHALNPTTRFTERAGEYDRFRPRYPDEAVDLTLEGLDPSAITIADIGAGTGIFARALAARGCRVIAIEPNAAMRSAARAPDSADSRIQWRDATGEQTGLAPASVDIVTCAQAFHWLKPQQAILEFCRILRPGGRIALLWNIGDESDPVARDYYTAIRRASSDFTTSHGRITSNPLTQAPLLGQQQHTLPNAQRLDAEGLIGRAMSASYIPRAENSPQRRQLVKALSALHAKHADADGMVTLAYHTHVYLAQAPSIPWENPT